jgi:GR25 family glycosyltransferase involved in LPS biosynthesis
LERLTRCDNNFESIKEIFPQAQRTAAVDASKLDVLNDARVSRLARVHIEQDLDFDFSHIASKGAIGCSLSHINLWKKCIALNQPIVIVEDDMYMCRRKQQAVKQAIATLPSDAQFCSILHIPTVTSGGVCNDDSWCSVRPRSFAGTQMYYVTPAGARHLLSEALPITMHIDAYISYMAHDESFKAYYYAKRIYTNLEFFRDHLQSSIGHAPSIKKLLPETNSFYVITISVLIVLTTYLLIKSSR